MGDELEHAILRVERDELAAVREALAERAMVAILGVGSIGWASDEVAVLAPAGVVEESAGAEVASTERLAPAAHGTGGVQGPGGATVVAMRWFELAASDWDEFLELSVGAWPAFESTYEATILGLFRSADCREPDARALLVTRYASLGEWERSREAGAGQGAAAEAGRRFRRRHQLTRRTIVRVGRPW